MYLQKYDHTLEKTPNKYKIILFNLIFVKIDYQTHFICEVFLFKLFICIIIIF